ncbi:MAG TPA: mechanosensitive ion channel protein MscS [Rhodospirillaceae bacterium]|nr:mechanosensitive ion channel protein MscS [Alphaproteobacteria bacterium]OUT42602.1 MAG: mechanosensitive ion channel protein MscS [Micavibrio sp. TMED2]HCI47365.1 mechanosensitive ion channel protein MscS [Rhodospirillaceae bacterium]MAS47237.1 mechanosensitive ion channel protein MscS [Alphaproteobacteria bacterium]MAX95330.1 mechanosensitive ion channel protein MscS [Alphaproteobacteria bacterium]
MQTAIDQAITLITEYGLDVVGAIVILVLGLIVSGWVSRAVRSGLSRVKSVDSMLRGFFASMAKYFVIAITLIAVLERFGVETTSFVAVLGAAGLAIGLALQGTLSNVAAGVMLLLFRPFKVGDYVEVAGLSGTVADVSLFTTELTTPDNVQIVTPNSDIWGTAIKNFSHHATRRVQLIVGIGYGDDMDKAIEVIKGVISAEERIHAEPAPFVAVSNLGDSSVDITIRVWCDAANFWPLSFTLPKAVKEAFDKNDISIPFPQRDVHMYQVAAS